VANWQSGQLASWQESASLASSPDSQLASWPNATKRGCAMTSRTAEIQLKIDLDAQNVATRIEWEAADAPGPATCQSMMLALWDSRNKTMAAIDLWTRDMTVDDMNSFFYQVLHKMADTYLRATTDESTAQSIHEFGDKFENEVSSRARVATVTRD
jgi:gliding motility-associated protein GldC